jgi:transketolase
MNKSRFAYLERITRFIEKDENIVFVSTDLGAPVLDKFRIQFSENFVNVGISEQNHIQIACGLALAGKQVVAYGMAPFVCTRAFDQIRNAVSLMNLPVSIIATGVGISEHGVTHYNIEDMSIIHILPNVQILNITDETMAKKAADYSLETNNPLYIRFDKEAEGNFYQSEEIDFNTGFKVFTQGKDIAIISYGYQLIRLLNLQHRFYENGINCKIIDLFSIPFDRERLLAELITTEEVVTVEEHVLSGGLGSIILELFSDFQIIKKVRRIGLRFSEYPDTLGSREYYMGLTGLSDDQIIRNILSSLSQR